ncbi:SagB family peptide dehydrogenase [soil metagenome]
MSGDVALLYRFDADIRSIDRKGDRITLDVAGWRSVTFAPSSPACADAVMALHGRGATLAHLSGIAGDGRKDDGIDHYIARFSQARFLSWTVTGARGDLAEITGLAGGYRPRPDSPPPGTPLALCRFAYLRRHEGRSILDSAAIRARATLSPAGIQALATSMVQSADNDGFAVALWQLGFFDLAEPREGDARRSWEFHDLVMHETSRFDRHLPRGQTYRFKDRFASPPAIRPPPTGERVGLPAVEAARPRPSSQPLETLQARRRSIRRYADRAMPLATVGEFLWRVCRTTGRLDDGAGGLITRPYPSAGNLNELEFYLAVRRCEGLSPAVYHYDGHGHGLTRLPASAGIAGKIVERAAEAIGLAADASRPDLTIVISSRIPRLAWKYESVAYRLSLLNVGVVFELMYLVATDMNLAPCASGSGSSQLLQAALDGDPYEEVAIGEFSLALPAD